MANTENFPINIKHIMIVELNPDYADEVWAVLEKRNMKHRMMFVDDAIRNIGEMDMETFKNNLADVILTM